jgi:transposase
MPDTSALTRSALGEFFSKDQLIDLVLELAEKVKQLTARVEELERQLRTPKKDSTNSSNPSSTDRAPKKNQSQRQKSGKKPGGQPGHAGQTRTRNPEPDQIVEHRPVACAGCKNVFVGREDERVSERRQMIEIPPIHTMTIEHQSIAVLCPCGKETRGAFPIDVPASICFGPNLRSLVTTLKEVHHFSYERLSQHLQDLCHLSLSQGTLCSLIRRVADRVSPRYQEIREEVRSGPTIESDETGMHITGKRAQLWVFRNSFATFFHVDRSRGNKVIERFLGALFTAAAWVSDRLGAHLMVVAHGGHQFCLAHLLRDFQFCIDAFHTSWSYACQRLLWKSIALRRTLDAMTVQGHDVWHDPPWIAWRLRAVMDLQWQWDRLFAEDRPKKNEEEWTLQRSLRKHPTAVFLFLHRSDVPPTNNGSERDLRPEKIHQKVIGGYRSMRGAQAHATILSVIQTARKRGENPLEVLQTLLS